MSGLRSLGGRYDQPQGEAFPKIKDLRKKVLPSLALHFSNDPSPNGLVIYICLGVRAHICSKRHLRPGSELLHLLRGFL